MRFVKPGVTRRAFGSSSSTKAIGWWRWRKLTRKALSKMAKKAKPNRRRKPSRRLRMKGRPGTVMQVHSLRRCAYLAISEPEFRALSAAGAAHDSRLCAAAPGAATILNAQFIDFLDRDLGDRRLHRRRSLFNEARARG